MRVRSRADGVVSSAATFRLEGSAELTTPVFGHPPSWEGNSGDYERTFTDCRDAGTYILDAYSFNMRLAEKRGTIERMDSLTI